MKASVPAPCPQVPGLLAPVQVHLDSVLRAPLLQLPASVPLVLLLPPLADSVLRVLPRVVSVPADSVLPVAWA